MRGCFTAWRRLCLLGLAVAGGWVPALAQQPSAPADTLPLGRFVRPAVHVGELIEYELTYRHDPALNVIFPDSSADFKPFEFVARRYWPTRTRNGRSLDRCRYTVRTFSLDSVQTLSLPVTLLRGRDTLQVQPAPAPVRLRRLAPRLAPESELPPLRQNTALQPVPTRFNYPYWVAALVALLVLAAVVWFTFGRRLRQRFDLYKMRRNHVYFLAQYARHLERFQLSRSLSNMERAITLWKNYLARLEDNALNTLTTREIVAHYQDDAEVRTALSLADRVIYGNLLPDEIPEESDEALAMLRRFADRRYEQQVARVV